jgi:serine/threonine protein kinase
LKPATKQEALSILLQIADAIAYLHDKGIIHRDVTPQNVIVNGSDATLIDFGFAAHFDQANPPSPPFTKTVRWNFFHELPGKWARPPELFDVSPLPQSDVFYIGILGIFMLLGYPLLATSAYLSEDRGWKFLARFLIPQAIDGVSTTNQDIKGDLLAILSKAVSEEIGARFRDGREMLLALKEVSRNE